MMNSSFLRIVPLVKSSARPFSQAIKYSVNGQAKDVYKLVKAEPLQALGSSDVALKFLAAPINPSDLNLAEGVYGTKPTLPAFGGNEGVAMVEEVGSSVRTLKVGDWVVPAKNPFGTWRQHAVADESVLIKVPNDIPAPYASSLLINPATAFRLLRDFVDLKPGDVIVQNGANSMVGMAVIQMAREMGVKTINIVRSDRPEALKVIRMLTNLGGDVNVLDTYVNTNGFNEIVREFPGVKLALNCVGGESAVNLARVLAPGGTLVSYGGMAKQPLSVPFDLLVERQLQLKGFWISKWYDNHTKEEASAMLHSIAKDIRDEKLKFLFRVHDFDDFAFALEQATEPFQPRKIVLNIDYPDRMREHDSRNKEDYTVFDAMESRFEFLHK